MLDTAATTSIIHVSQAIHFSDDVLGLPAGLSHFGVLQIS